MIKQMITGTTLLFTFTVLTLQVSSAQAYQFTHFSAPYQELTNATVLEACDLEFPIVPLGFNFPFLNNQVDSLEVDINFLYHEKPVNGVVHGVQFFPFGAGYACRETPNSEVSYATVQENGHPVFIVQWKNLGFYEDTIGNQFLNMQLKLYDSDKAIEVRFGGMQIEQENIYFTGEPGGFVAGIAYTNPNSPIFDPACFTLYGNASNPSMDPSFNPDSPFTQNMIGHPDSSMVYRFHLQDAGIDSPEQSFFSIYPNPVKTDYLHIHSLTPLETIRIFTISGQKTGENRKPDALSNISIADLEKGTYLIEATSETGTQTIRFIRE
ncbi:T9SS type A sorting domain-containing protein [Fluviicola sp.]|uniref:T9SS type A sorting domain-containing protein n=1 Tax=Fluviicola sp. TaxID=1917219 RepID=UPI003D2D2968